MLLTLTATEGDLWTVQVSPVWVPKPVSFWADNGASGPLNHRIIQVERDIIYLYIIYHIRVIYSDLQCKYWIQARLLRALLSWVLKTRRARDPVGFLGNVFQSLIIFVEKTFVRTSLVSFYYLLLSLLWLKPQKREQDFALSDRHRLWQKAHGGKWSDSAYLESPHAESCLRASLLKYKILFLWKGRIIRTNPFQWVS